MSDSSDGSSLETGVDGLLKHLDELGKASASKLAEKMNVDENKIKNWGKALEKSDIVEVKYSGLKGMVLKYDSEKSFDEIDEAGEILDTSNTGEEELEGQKEENKEIENEEDTDDGETGSTPRTVHRKMEEDEEKSESGTGDRKNVQGSLKAEENSDEDVKVDLSGAAASAGGGKDDVVESSEVKDSNVIEIDDSEIKEMNIGDSQKESEKKEEKEEVEDEETVDEEGEDDVEVVITEDEDDEEETEEVVVDGLGQVSDEESFLNFVDKSVAKKVGNLNNLVEEARNGEDVYDDLENELSGLKNEVELDGLPDQEKEEILDCMEEAEKELNNRPRGLLHRLKSRIFGSENETDEINLEEELENKNEDEEKEEEDESSEKRESSDLDDEIDIGQDLDDIHDDIVDLSEEKVDYVPGEDLTDILDNVNELSLALENGENVENVYEKLDVETERMKDIIKQGDLTGRQKQLIIKIMDSMENILDKKENKGVLKTLKKVFRGLMP